jgi:hypothetical protein
MVLAFYSYITDTGKIYNFLPVFISQLNPELSTLYTGEELLNDLLPNNLIDINSPCAVSGLIQRSLIVRFDDASVFRIGYSNLFSEFLADQLIADPRVDLFTFNGETIRYFRLNKLLT